MNETKYTQVMFDKALEVLLDCAKENGVKHLPVISKKLHDIVVRNNYDNRMPMACNAMWKLWEKQGSHKNRVIHTTQSHKSSTIEIEFSTD